MTHSYVGKPWAATFVRNSQVEPLRGKSVPIELTDEKEIIPQAGYRKKISAQTIMSAMHTAWIKAVEYNATRELKAISTVTSVTLSEHRQSPGRNGEPRSIYLIDVNGEESYCQLVVKDETLSLKCGAIVG